MNGTDKPWWTGPRGEWYVVAQAILFVLIAWGPRQLGGVGWPLAATASQTAAMVLLALGLALSIAAAIHLGRNLTPLPHPKDDAAFVASGPYRLVRHPMYGGVILLAFGWAFHVEGVLTLVDALLTVAFFDLKTRREERWLMRRFPEYAAYRAHVRKLIPFVY